MKVNMISFLKYLLYKSIKNLNEECLPQYPWINVTTYTSFYSSFNLYQQLFQHFVFEEGHHSFSSYLLLYPILWENYEVFQSIKDNTSIIVHLINFFKFPIIHFKESFIVLIYHLVLHQQEYQVACAKV